MTPAEQAREMLCEVRNAPVERDALLGDMERLRLLAADMGVHLQRLEGLLPLADRHCSGLAALEAGVRYLAADVAEMRANLAELQQHVADVMREVTQ